MPNHEPDDNFPAAEHEIDVFPAKHFFVDSLTRDIDLSDAILDLLDNCVDGVRRQGLPPGGEYTGHWAKLRFDGEGFSIEDNCGGISLHDAEHSAFRFGRPADYIPDANGTIGIIGIGMKRAILKMGKRSVVHSFHRESAFEVRITPEWLKEDNNWKLPIRDVKPTLPAYGTRIEVSALNESVREQFGTARFRKTLRDKVSGAFSLLISRGFAVFINDKPVEGRTPTLLWQENTSSDAEVIRPYLYRSVIDSVEIYVAVGFRVEDKVPDEDEETRRYYRTEAAGWTVACNDRVVLYCDKSEQTGWGTAGVPVYHTQFINISGFAEFRSDDTDKLPFTTTKHGINQQSDVYQKALHHMRVGTKLFTDWTNLIKPFATQKAEIFSAANARSMSVEEIKAFVESPIHAPAGEVSLPVIVRPVLPKPATSQKEVRVSFRRRESEIRAVSLHLFGEEESASRVGERCFEQVLNETQ